MAQVLCRYCSSLIPAPDVNVESGIAFCRSCEQVSRLTDILIDASVLDDGLPVCLSQPPPGCTIQQLNDGSEIKITATARSLRGLFMLLFVTVACNFMVAFFSIINLAMTAYHLFGSIPSWLPTPTVPQSPSAADYDAALADAVFPLSVVILAWMVILPFGYLGLYFLGMNLTTLLGKCVVTLAGKEGHLFTGIGRFGRRRVFKTTAIKSVSLKWTHWMGSADADRCVALAAFDQEVRFAKVLPKIRKIWMTLALQHYLAIEQSTANVQRDDKTTKNGSQSHDPNKSKP